MSDAFPAEPLRQLTQSHPRSFGQFRYVYPVLSRRAGGISLGVNLNLDKACNFHCIYCQVDRTSAGLRQRVELSRLAEELDQGVELVVSGRIYEDVRFRAVPAPLRRLNDIALSGDGEPTARREFPHVVDICAQVRRRHRLEAVKLILITNASLLHRPAVRKALDVLDANHGEIWAKLDAGTQTYFRQIARSGVHFQRIVDNITDAARLRPLVIQSLFMRVNGQPPPVAEQAAYCDRLHDIVRGGGRIQLVQVYTVARPPAESFVAPLDAAELDALADEVRRRTGLPVAVFYGSP